MIDATPSAPPTTDRRDPLLSVVVATDTLATLRPVLERLRRQHRRDRVELVLVVPHGTDSDGLTPLRSELAGVILVEVDDIDPLHRARAAGVRAATAPLVFLGETHSFPAAGFVDALLQRFNGPWAAIAPGFGNANPKGAWSWSGFLSDYARWATDLPAGEIDDVPRYNAAYRRDLLLGLGDDLDEAFGFGDALPNHMKRRNGRCYLETAARLDHANVARPLAWVHERFVAGLLIAEERARAWPLWRRLGYLVASPLIPFVLLYRTLPGIAATARSVRIPRFTLPLVVFGMFVKAAGEMCGYAWAPPGRATAAMHEYEVHKLAYLGRSRR